MPKYRGDSEDWLDEEGEQRKGSRSKKRAAATSASQVLPNATVIEVFPQQCRVLLDSGEVLNAFYRRALIFEGGKAGGHRKERAPVAVGDRVYCKQETAGVETIARLESVAPRRNKLSRPAPEVSQEHVLVANVDLLIIVSSVSEPEFSPGIVDRYLIAAALQNLSPIVCVSKADLISTEMEQIWKFYESLGVPVFLVSSRTQSGLSELKAALQDKISVFCGHSGVGKTSLLNELLDENFKTGQVNEVTGKGKHTTTSARWLTQGETVYIDTPGIREFGLVGLKAEDLKDYFPEFKAISCASSCLHRPEEEGCALGKQLETFIRYPSYLRILQSLIEEETEDS